MPTQVSNTTTTVEIHTITRAELVNALAAIGLTVPASAIKLTLSRGTGIQMDDDPADVLTIQWQVEV